MAQRLTPRGAGSVFSPLRVCVLVSAALFGLRVYLAQRVAFGDAEALYLSYALFPQPGYLDHPGLVGSVGQILGNGAVPTPYTVHLLSALLATLVPWIGGWAAWRAGAASSGALRTVLCLALVPELSIGLFGLTPDLLLACFWLGALGFGAKVLSPNSTAGTLSYLGLGACLAMALLSKVSGGLLALVVAACVLQSPVQRRRVGPYLGAALALLLVYPWVHWEWSQGAPMLTHRLSSTQGAAGLSLRNVGALLGGQLLYVTPPFLLGAWTVARSLRRSRTADPVSALLWRACVVPGALLGALCLWSRVAEPHWIAPMYLSLAVQLGRLPPLAARLQRIALSFGAIAVAFALFWVGTDYPPRLLGKHYHPRYDLTNDLYAWGPGKRLLNDVVQRTVLDAQRLPVVVGPHWIICAQAQLAIGRSVRVGCNTPIPDDFDRWLPREKWRSAAVVLYVHDSRFDVVPSEALPGRVERSRSKVDVLRGGRVVRTLWVTRLDLSDGLAAQGAAGASRLSPASRISASSVLSPGLGVVSNVSP